MRHAAFSGVKRDGFDLAASAASSGCVTELVEGNDEHFEGPKGPAYIREVPEQSDDDDVGSDDAKGGTLGTVHSEAATKEMVRGGERYCFLYVRGNGEV